MKPHLLLAAAAALALAGAAHAKCYELADIDGFGPQTKFKYCDDSASAIRLNLDQMKEAPQSINGYLVPGPEADIVLPDETISAEAITGWAQDRATNRGFILTIEDPAEALKMARTINAGEAFDIVLTDADGTEFTAFSGTFAMRFPDEMVQ